MVANRYDGLDGRVERGVDDEAPFDTNGVDVYQHLSCNVGWQVLETR